MIASKLEDIRPTPSLYLDAELQAEVDRIVHMTCLPLFANYMPLVAREIIDESTVPAFAKPREARFGMTLQELEEKKGGRQAWVAAEPGFVEMKKILTIHKVDDGPFIHGSQVCYADFMLVAVFEAFARADREMFTEAIGSDIAFQQLCDASQAWLQNDE